MKNIVISMFIVFSVSNLHGTPSTQIWNPSTDIQGLKTMHLGIDNYFSVVNNNTKPYAFATDTGLTYGLVKNLEIGIDILEPLAEPLLFNVKYGFSEGDKTPAFAFGGMNIGTKANVTDYNIIYGVIAKTFKPIGRLSLGYYSGNAKLLIDENGIAANTGAIVSWDKQLTDKVWASIDYASGQSFYGETSAGFSYGFSANTSVIFGYVVFNNDKININNQVTTQLDINF